MALQVAGLSRQQNVYVAQNATFPAAAPAVSIVQEVQIALMQASHLKRVLHLLEDALCEGQHLRWANKPRYDTSLFIAASLRLAYELGCALTSCALLVAHDRLLSPNAPRRSTRLVHANWCARKGGALRRNTTGHESGFGKR